MKGGSDEKGTKGTMSLFIWWFDNSSSIVALLNDSGWSSGNIQNTEVFIR